MFTLSIKLKNEAFDGEARTTELVRIIQTVARDLEGGWTCGSILDINGNTVGKWSAKPNSQGEK